MQVDGFARKIPHRPNAIQLCPIDSQWMALTGSKSFVYPLEPVYDRHLLRARLFAVAALDTLISTLFGLDPSWTCVTELTYVEVSVHHGFVVQSKDIRNQNPIGTGLAIATRRAGNGRKLSISLAHFAKQVEIS